jgi:hypothetical protein
VREVGDPVGRGAQHAEAFWRPLLRVRRRHGLHAPDPIARSALGPGTPKGSVAATKIVLEEEGNGA